MPLTMGDWKLFIDKKQLSMKFSALDNRGHFMCQIIDLLVGVPALHGEGYWNELAEQVSFSMNTEIPNFGGNKINYFFNGYQIEGVSTIDSASDKLWTLAGSCQVSVIGESLEHLPKSLELLVQHSRRQALGWYAQITEIL